MYFHGDIERDKLFAITSSSAGKRLQLVWVGLNTYDNDVQHFWITLSTAFSAWNLQFSNEIRQASFPSTNAESDAFLSSLQANIKENPLLMVMNNYQCIRNEAIQQFLVRFTKMEGMSAALILSEGRISTGEKGSIVFDHIDQSRYFTKEEERQCYIGAGFTLSEEEFDAAHSVTDGWRAAVDVLIGLIQEQGPTFFDHLKNNLIDWLENRFYARYTQPELQQLFCLSLLDEFPLALVQHLGGWSGETLLPILWSSPVIRYNTHSRCFYFCTYLKRYIQESQCLLPASCKQTFYTQVADWYRDHGQKVEAITYYRKAGAICSVLQVMNQWSFPATRELAGCYVDTIQSLPPDLLDAYPLLHIIRAHMLSTLYRYKEGDALMRAFCHTHDKGAETDPKIAAILGEAYLVWANMMTCMNEAGNLVFPLYERAAELLPNGSTMIRQKLNIFSDSPVVRLTSKNPGTMESYFNWLIKAEPYLIQLSCGGWAGCSHLARAEIDYYTRNFKDVEANAGKAIMIGLDHKQYDLVCSACFLIMRMSFAKGNYKKTHEALELLRQYASEANYDAFFSMPDLAEAWFQLKLGRPQKIPHWLKDETHYQQTLTPWNYGRGNVIRAMHLLEVSQYEELLAYTKTNIALFKKRGYHLLNISLLVMTAIAYHALGETRTSAEQLEEIYHWCHGNNMVMPLVEYGRHIPPLIETYRLIGEGRIPEVWLSEMEKKSNTYYLYQYNMRKKYRQQSWEKPSISDLLTVQEQKLLLMISRGMTARAIAEMQGKSVGTIKNMSHRVYVKIGANSKADAIRIAMNENIESLVRL